jgi:hypothetical protein
LAVLSACRGSTSLPDAPKGNFCTHAASRYLAVCTNLKTGEVAPFVSIRDTDKWIMFSPTTWTSIQNYIDALIRKVEQKQMMLGADDTVVLTKQDLKEIKNYLKYIQDKNKKQR